MNMGIYDSHRHPNLYIWPDSEKQVDKNQKSEEVELLRIQLVAMSKRIEQLNELIR